MALQVVGGDYYGQINGGVWQSMSASQAHTLTDVIQSYLEATSSIVRSAREIGPRTDHGVPVERYSVSVSTSAAKQAYTQAAGQLGATIPNDEGMRAVTHQIVDLDRRTRLPIRVLTHTVGLWNLGAFHEPGVSGVVTLDVVDVDTYTYPAGGS